MNNIARVAVNTRLLSSGYNRAFLRFALNFYVLFNNNIALMRTVL